jgi:hypothetical protein
MISIINSCWNSSAHVLPLATWNHRAFLHRHPEWGDWYTIREAYYDKEGNVDGWTVEAIAPGGETIEELRTELQRMLKCLDQPVLDDVERE